MMQHMSFSRFLVLSAVTLAAACQRGAPPQQGSGEPAAATPVTAPDSFLVAFETSKGRIVVQAVRAWAPRGADRFYDLVTRRYYDGNKFFRVLGFMGQFGISGDPQVNAVWRDRQLPDDPVTQSNQRGYVSFAMGGPDTRTTQLFINKRDNKRLDGMGFSPFARVIEGMGVVDSLYSGYGEGAPDGTGPDQQRIEGQGNAYLNRYFPKLDSIVTARVVRIKQD